mgnify:CR=1 FL=1
MAELYQPTLVIGLGGTGKNIILALKKMIAENCEHGMADFPFLKLLSIDTDRAVPHTQSSIKTVKDESLFLNPNREVFQLQANFGIAPDLNDYPQIHEWFPDSLKSSLRPADLSRGASQKKPIGRFTFAWNASEIYEEINAFMRAPVDVKIAIDKNIGSKLSKEINVFICGSVCGGTGAGTFLDTAYLVRYCNHIAGNDYKVKIFGMLALASMFDGIQGTANVRQNCYASLVELDHFMNKVNCENPYRSFTPAYKDFKPDYTASGSNKPFDYSFLFDNFGKGVALNSQSAFSEMAARFIYLLTGHELGTHWTSMYNNVMANLERNYKNLNNKDIHYSGMGTFSILYPKRMIVQLCAYNLSKEYLAKILDDSYAPQEVENLAKNFLKEIKMNPLTNQLEDSFDVFNEPNGFKGSFKDYIENAISDFEEQSVVTDKKDLKDELIHWKKDIDEKVIEFRNLNSTRAEKIRESFLAQLKKELELLLDLHEHKLGVKKNSDGTDLADRGSIVRAFNFVECLIKIFTEAKDKYRRIRNDSESTMRNLNGDFETALSDFDEAVDNIFATKKKIAEAKEKLLNVCRDLFNAQKKNYIADWCFQLFTDILWNDVPKFDGLIKELESYRNKYRKAILTFKEIDADINKFLDNNRRFEPNPLFAVIFDYEKDVLQAYKNLVEEKSEEFIFGELSDSVTQDGAFGKEYLGVANKTSTLVNIDILNATEKFFFEPINRVNISDRILETPEICDRLEQGTYFEATPIYLGVEDMVMNREGLTFKDSTFFAISIPDEYEGKPCKDIKGVVRGNGVNNMCPMEQDPDKYQKEPCPMFNKCLKQKLLHHAPSNVAITPTSEISEVNIMHSIAGYPLYALSSVMNNCKSVYEEAKAKQQRENEESGTDYEEINMFGSLQFDALDEKSIDPRKQQNEFRKLLLVAFIAKRLKVQALSIDFVTERDLMQDRKDKPSLHLGNSMNKVMVRFQSSRLADKKDIAQFEKEVGHFKEKLSGNEDKFYAEAEKLYTAIKNELPSGFIPDDLDLMNDVVKEITNKALFDTKESPGSLWG